MYKEKFCILGNGVVGSAISKILEKNGYEYILLSHKDFEITNQNDYNKIIDFKPDILINTVALLGIEVCEKEQLKAYQLNVKANYDLIKLCNDNNILFVYISSDSIFDGKKGGYIETDMPNPLNIYGLTKYNGEIITHNLANQYYIFRLSVLFGNRDNKGISFLNKMEQIAINNNNKLLVSNDIICNPSYNIDIANKIIEIITQKYEYGIYHIFNEGEVSLYELTKEYFKLKNLEIDIKSVNYSFFAKNELSKRALKTYMKTTKILPLRNWKEALQEYIKVQK